MSAFAYQFRLKLTGLLGLWLVCCHCLAVDLQPQTKLGSFTGQLNLVSNLSYLTEPENVSPDYIPPLTSDDWQANLSGLINYGQQATALWFRLTLSNLHQLDQTTYLRINYPHLDAIDVYLVNDQEIEHWYKTGDSLPFSSRPVNHASFLFPVNDWAASSNTVLMRIESASPLLLPIELISRTALDQSDKKLNLWNGAYFGIMIAMVLYNGIIFLLVRQTSYLLYITYISAVIFLQFTIDGYSFQFLWPNSPSLNNQVVLFATALMPLCAVVFVWNFIGLGKIGAPYERRIIMGIATGFLVAIAAIPLAPYPTVLNFLHVLSFTTIGLGIFSGIKYWRLGVKSARIFTLAWSVYLVFVIYYLLAISGVVQPTMISQHALEIGSLVEVVLLSLAFGDRLKEEMDLRLQTQEKLTLSLDSLVRERTQDLETANKQLQHLSITDGLTQLYNRSHFDRLYEAEFIRAFREKQDLAVLLLDLDHFKTVNDTYGHLFGDECLRQVATTVLNCIRRPPDIAARFGGEEFVVVLPNTNTEGAIYVANKIRTAVAALEIPLEDQIIRVTISIGVNCGIPQHRDDCSVFLKLADNALYQAKHKGRNCVVSTNESL